MATAMKRVMLTIAPEMTERIEMLKQGPFYNKSYSELYRHLLTLGLEAEKDRSEEKRGETPVNRDYGKVV